ncbi:hypothetical protein MNB_SM-7-1146 [hydrothermal vent metagenome]|uniref:Uncharacterized protein n=1 Tax=hydrothermal vent metagenome TaxID=652676 RepID=A0A1W1BAU8_9ZZZZ
MFDFLDSDWFNITLEIIFLILILFDIRKYMQTKKQEYLLNIILTIGFAIWALWPYYNSYIKWSKEEKKALLSTCQTEKNATLCQCMDDAIFKNYTYDEYKNLDKNGSDFKEFLKDAKEECSDESWF